MRTDELIDVLSSAPPETCGRRALELRLACGAALGLLGVAGVVILWGGVRADLPQTLAGAGLAKFGGGVALAAGAFHLLRRMARPGTPPIDGVCMGLFALAAAVVLGVIAAAQVTAPLSAAIRSAPRYAWMMGLLSAIPLATLLIALRAGASTRPAGAGAAAGLLAGAVTALGYALWCPADDALFVALSYGTAIAATVAAGAFAGARLLRW